MDIRFKRYTADFLVAVLFIVIFVNPYVENLMYYDPLLYMLSHYSIYAAGLILGYRFLKTNQIYFYLGIVPAAIWHLPYPFILGASNFYYRLLSEVTLFFGGISTGSSINSVSFKTKITFLTLWMVGDTYLSILFLLGTKEYTKLVYNFSYYLPQQLPIVGISMLILMNLVIAYVIYVYVKSYLRHGYT
jgi:Protein of unknown function (DUF1404).